MLESFDQRRYLIPFRSQLLPHIFTDTLIIGAGVAGLRAAVEASGHGDVIVLAKDAVELSNTAWAQGGIAAVLSNDDSADLHVQDTLEAGAGLCDADVVRTLVDEGPDRVRELIDWGMRLDRQSDGSLHLTREGGHHRSRIVHADGDATGRELVRCLAARVNSLQNVRLFEKCFALDLLTVGPRNERRVLGAITWHPRYGLQIIWAKATILASGGAGQVYRETTNPKVATGDGLAMAYRAGALVADLEFIQFHPTALYVAGASRTLITEAVRGEGGYLVDRNARRFMTEYHDMAELAPRDVVSRAIVNHLNRTQESSVFLDVRHLDARRFEARFPDLIQLLRGFDINPATDLIPVRPCSHYTIGGVWTDADGRTSLPGLLACGEAACNGIHGANRLASNSLLEGLVFGRRAAIAARETAHTASSPTQIISDIPISDHGELDLSDVRSSLQSAMWRNVGIERVGNRLADVMDMCRFWARYTMDMIFDDPDGWETQNLLTVAALVTQAAHWRTETRGVHCRLDYPAPDDHFLTHAQWLAGQTEPATIQVAQASRVFIASTSRDREGAVAPPSSPYLP